MKITINWIQKDCLFSAKEQYLMSHDSKGRDLRLNQMSNYRKGLLDLDNKRLVASLTKFTDCGIPIMEAYTGPTDLDYVSYTDRKKAKGQKCMIGFFMHDKKFRFATWEKLESTTRKLMDFEVIIAPDYSLYVHEQLSFLNKENVYRSRVVGAYWQKCGLKVIPVASWGDANSFSYCFEGLPNNSVIAVSGTSHGKDGLHHRLWIEAIKELVRQKNPITILVYGGDECNIPGVNVPVKFIKDFIHKRLRK